jgi:putative NADPH-quinone reductase
MQGTMRLLFFAGSAREGSFNKRLAKLGAEIAKANGIAATFADLGDYVMPLYDGDAEAQSGAPENALKLKALMQAHDGIFIAAPEYNASITPLLKNALDWVAGLRFGCRVTRRLWRHPWADAYPSSSRTRSRRYGAAGPDRRTAGDGRLRGQRSPEGQSATGHAA